MPLVTLWVGLGLAVQFSARGAAAVSPGASYSADLIYHETDEALASQSLDFKLRSNPFLKEPALGRQEVFRGVLLCGDAPTRPPASSGISPMAGSTWT